MSDATSKENNTNESFRELFQRFASPESGHIASEAKENGLSGPGTPGHRDIKPSNIFLYGQNDARLGDFGVSAEMSADGTARAHGDPPIRPPEAWLEGEMDARSDLVSGWAGPLSPAGWAQPL